MLASSPASSNNIKYYSAHRGPVYGADGKFHHFARQCDPVHLKNGYWQFSTYDDDRRAHMHGFHNPEEVLKAQDAGDGEYDDIFLLWVPGQLDTSNKTSMGTAAVHLQTIYNERKLLRKTLSFRGAVPLYPVSTDPRLLQYRLTRYGVQRGKLPTDLLSPTSSSQDMRLMQTLSPAPPPTTTITPIDSTSRAKGPVSQAEPILAPKAQSSPTQSKTIQSSPSTSAPETPSFDQIPVRSSAPVAATHALEPKAPSNPGERLRVSLPVHHDRIDSPLNPPNINAKFISTLAKDKTEHLQTHQSEELFLVDDDGACHVNDNEVATTEDAVDNVDIISLAASTPENMYRLHTACLPCMDCGLVGSHTSACWINEVTTKLKSPKHLMTSELNDLVTQVTEFDPVPWTTHNGPPQQIVEDPESSMRSMAEVIRNLDETAEDPDLQGLNDQFTILLWALKSIGEVQVLEEGQELSDVEMLDA
jgi:hypothetical protein